MFPFQKERHLKAMTHGGRICCKNRHRISYGQEIQINKPASAALKLIDDKGYMIPYSADGRKLYKIGVSFSTKTRTVEDWDYNIG